MQAIDDQQVRLRVRAQGADGQAGGKRSIAIEGVEFIARLLQHVLPSGFKRIRHYGLLAPAGKATALATARGLLQMPAPSAKAREDAQTFMRRVAAVEIERCPHCSTGRWRVVREVLAARLPLLAVLTTHCRGPP